MRLNAKPKKKVKKIGLSAGHLYLLNPLKYDNDIF